MRDPILFCTVFAFLATSYHVETRPQGRARPVYDPDIDLTADRATQYYCTKLKSCTAKSSGAKVCGYDAKTPWLAEFEDMCTLYKVNCKSDRNIFIPVEQVVCDTRIKYDKEHGSNNFDVIHIRVTTTYHPVLKTGGARYKPRVKLYYYLFASYHCYQRMICTPGGGWVCGDDSGMHASFPDKCHLHGVNCRMQGLYWQIGTELCKPAIKWAEALTVYEGEVILTYSTMSGVYVPKLRNGTRTKNEKKVSFMAKLKDSLGISSGVNISIEY